MGYGLSGACRDVSSVEVMMNYHQGLKSEVEARNKSVIQCIEMGKTLLAARNPASEEVMNSSGIVETSEMTKTCCLKLYIDTLINENEYILI